MQGMVIYYIRFKNSSYIYREMNEMITCSKMNGNGNDFLIINNMDLKYDTSTLIGLTKKICRRRESIGADGLLVVEPSNVHAFKMRLINRDGVEGEMCGNGARCMARYAYEKKIIDDKKMTFETLGGDVEAEVNGNRVILKLAEVDLDNAVVDKMDQVGDFNFSYTYMVVGVPHVVIFESIRRSDDEYRKYGRLIRNRLDLFPEGANVNFVVAREDKKDTLDVVTYERGVEDLTLSCGTGSTASAIASVLIGLTGPNVDVFNPGGLNKVSIKFESSNKIVPKLEGGALLVADLTLTEEALA
ncbi:MAG: diaminopimelate epimerase [Synergistaceae bacterium]